MADRLTGWYGIRGVKFPNHHGARLNEDKLHSDSIHNTLLLRAGGVRNEHNHTNKECAADFHSSDHYEP